MLANMNKEPYDIYIGRVNKSNLHYGNPSQFINDIDKYELWLRGCICQDVEPERRSWILGTLHILQGKILGSQPQQKHGEVLLKLISELVEVTNVSYSFVEVV